MNLLRAARPFLAARLRQAAPLREKVSFNVREELSMASSTLFVCYTFSIISGSALLYGYGPYIYEVPMGKVMQHAYQRKEIDCIYIGCSTRNVSLMYRYTDGLEALINNWRVINTGEQGYYFIKQANARDALRAEYLQRTGVPEWKPRAWPPPSLENDEINAKEAVADESEGVAGEEAKTVSTDDAPVMDKAHTESTADVRKEEDPPVEKASSAGQEEQGAPSNTEEEQSQD